MYRAIVFLWIACWTLQYGQAQLAVELVSFPPSGQPVGTRVSWRASAPDVQQPYFLFEARLDGGPWRLVRDYSANPVLDWVTIEEGSYEMRVRALDLASGERGQTSRSFDIQALAGPTVQPTSHPLVALYGAPACAEGRVRVRFRVPDTPTTWQHTPWKTCQGKSLHFYVAGMLENTSYQVQQESLAAGRLERGPVLTFQTGTASPALPAKGVTNPPDRQTDAAEGVLLASLRKVQSLWSVPVATDLLGRVIWYYDPPGFIGSILMRPLEGGNMLLTTADLQSTLLPLFREVDLAGNLIRETSSIAINLQLAARGEDQVTVFHHDAIRLSNGYTAVLAEIDRILTDVQGPGPVKVVGDLILVLDENFQVTWTWNAFEFLDPTRKAVLDEECQLDVSSALGDGPIPCKDWTHSNALQYLPQDGNLLLTVRHQDWVVKVDYRDGAGTGEVLWRMGPEGDFTLLSSDPWPWFSHPHDMEFDGGQWVVYDNGNTRRAQLGPTAHSRGQAYLVDEENRRAILVLNADLGYYASRLGSAERLSNGNYHFLSGGGVTLPDGTHINQHIELLPSAEKNYVLTWEQEAYRSFRMKSLYSP
ncbi:MAG: aryl-sulfate sulfotransferase [Acidobacteriota bacterium]